MKRNLIIIGGGILQIPLIQTARSMGLSIVVFDMSASAPGMALADKGVVMSTKDIEGCVREARKLAETMTIHGVVTAGTDASRAVAAIAAALELPGIRYADAEAASNKVTMRRRLQRFHLPIPRFASVWSLKEAREALSEMELPLVLKPSDNMGARGVIKIRRREDLQQAFLHTKKYSPTGEMILEEFMEGPELSVDALAWNGNFRITGIADRIISGEPYFIELGHNMPSALSPDILMEATNVMFAAMKALGIHTGAGKGDLKVTPKGVMIGEVAARLSGGFMSSHTYPLHSGVNLLRAAIQIALGDEPDSLDPVENRVAIERGIFVKPGKILSISGLSQAKSARGIHDIFITNQVGDLLRSPTSNLDKMGHVIAVADSLESAEACVKEAMRHIDVSVDDAFGVDWKEVETKARQKFGDSVCRVCRVCDGFHCSSGVPGMGGAGRMSAFQDNSRALAEIRILPRYIRTHVTPDTTLELFGRKFESPVMIAPITGAQTNMNGAISEYEFARTLLLSARESGTISWLGDGASPEKYRIFLDLLDEMEGFGIMIFKPRKNSDEILTRIKEAEKRRIIAFGIDIDSIDLPTMNRKNQSCVARDFESLHRLREAVKIPFILKGVMSVEDLRMAIRVGADAIVVSNHGGRILDDMPGTARILPEIAEHARDRIPILVDGGVRTGQDVFKMIALGAKGVLVGRPFAIAAVGGGSPAVKFLLNRFQEELRQTMNICGTESLQNINPTYLMRVPGEERSIPAKNIQKETQG